jgi:hypothetical protein
MSVARGRTQRVKYRQAAGAAARAQKPLIYWWAHKDSNLGDRILWKNGGLARLLTSGRHARLETNTSLSHICLGQFGHCEPRVRIPVKRFLARPFSLEPAPRSRRCLEKQAAAHRAAGVLTRK